MKTCSIVMLSILLSFPSLPWLAPAVDLGVSGATVCVAYRAVYIDGSTYTWDVLLARSTDGGATW